MRKTMKYTLGLALLLAHHAATVHMVKAKVLEVDVLRAKRIEPAVALKTK